MIQLQPKQNIYRTANTDNIGISEFNVKTIRISFLSVTDGYYVQTKITESQQLKCLGPQSSEATAVTTNNSDHCKKNIYLTNS